MAERGDRVDFKELVAALLARADTIVPQWLPAGTKRAGRWYVGDFDGAPGKSANVNLKTGQWIDNGHPDADKGGDLLSLYCRITGKSPLDAARELMRDNGWMTAPVKPARRTKAEPTWMPMHPVPADAPDYRSQWAHYARGVPPLHWEYRDRAGQLLGLVVRFDNTSDGRKDVQPISFCQASDGRRQWRYKAFGQPRPLYGLWRLPPLAEPGDGEPPPKRALAIVVEGEKKADRLYEALGSQTPVLSWPGGCKTVALADWTALAAYRLVCWPDADAKVDTKSGEMLPAELQPGLQAMRKVQATMIALGAPVRVVDVGAPGERADGWDAADAVAEGWTRDQLLAFMSRFLPDLALASRAVAPVADAPMDAGDPGPDDDGRSTPTEAAPGRGSGGARWRLGYVMMRGSPRECGPNVSLVLRNHPEWEGVVAFDRFAQRVVKRRPAPFDEQSARPSDEWTDVDDTRTTAWVARREGWLPSSSMVAEAVNEVAHSNGFHPVLEWLDTLRHDGVPRLDDWMIDTFGVTGTPYVRRVSRYFLIGMCMRVLEPGCKFDYCLVLEGAQGRRKSTALRILGGEWFSDIELDLANKDSMSNIRGKWLHEFGEMGSLARSESNRQKSFLSRQVDEFRPVYGRREIRCPRQSAFCGSTNEWAWNKDPTGGRRFWPVEVGDEIDTVALVAMREQLFAEAYAAAKAHIADRETNRYWPTAEEQRDLFDPEQLSRESPDVFVDLLADWLESDAQVSDVFTMAQAGMAGLKLDAKALTKDVQTRVGHALKKLGCTRIERRTKEPRHVYKRPPRNAASSPPGAGVNGESGNEEVPF